MPQIQSSYEETRIPFSKMSFTPDVPSTALGPNEYNQGSNVETDVRGIKSVYGDQEILDTVPGTPIFVTGSYRQDGNFWFVVANVEGDWYATTNTTWEKITPNEGDTLQPAIAGYTIATNITESWNGTVPVFNDNVGNPMFWPDVGTGAPVLVRYGTLTELPFSSLSYPSAGVVRINYTTSQATIPFDIGGYVLVQNANTANFNNNWLVLDSTTTYVDIECPLTSIAIGVAPTVNQSYVWNYLPETWTSLKAGFVRMFASPNVGSILVAGDLTITDVDSVVTRYPTTISWSQAFGLNQMPATWEPNLLVNVADQLGMPLRGPLQDAFPSNGQLYVCSYWDTVVLSPLNYTTTSDPILGVRLFNTGRGLLNPSCSVNTDKIVYGIDARDIWMFDGQQFTGIGNQRVKNWFYDQLDPAYTDMIHMEVNTQKNQIEIYYPTTTADNGVPNKMLSYRYDLDVWNAPRDVVNAIFTIESPVWSYDVGSSTWFNDPASRCVVYAQGAAGGKLVMKDQGTEFLVTGTNPTGTITSVFRRDNIKLLKDYSGKMMVHRILPEVNNVDQRGITIVPSTGSIDITIEGANSVGSASSSSTPITVQLDTDNPWAQINQNSFRVNNIEMGDASTTDTWICAAITWQFTQTEDDR